MQKLLKGMLGLLLVAGLVNAVLSAPAGSSPTPVPVEKKSLGTVRQDIDKVLNEREVALRELNARYEAAPLDQRVAIEAEAARIQNDYQRRYLELLVDYHRLSGDTEELARAERMLETLNAGAVTGTPLSLPRDRQAAPAPTAKDQPREGVVPNDR